MNPALTTIQNDVRAAELRARAERERGLGSRRRRRTTTEEIAQGTADARGAIFGSLFLGHGFFGREHGTHA